MPQGSNNKVWDDRATPRSMSPIETQATGAWSVVPIWRGLDAAFLCEPSIPKAPPPPRINISSRAPASGVAALPQTQPVVHDAPNATPDRPAKPRHALRTLLISAAIGFGSGVLVAWYCGLLG